MERAWWALGIGHNSAIISSEPCCSLGTGPSDRLCLAVCHGLIAIASQPVASIQTTHKKKEDHPEGIKSPPPILQSPQSPISGHHREESKSSPQPQPHSYQTKKNKQNKTMKFQLSLFSLLSSLCFSLLAFSLPLPGRVFPFPDLPSPATPKPNGTPPTPPLHHLTNHTPRE